MVSSGRDVARCKLCDLLPEIKARRLLDTELPPVYEALRDEDLVDCHALLVKEQIVV